ncbi:MAG: nucleoside deaminase [Bacteroidetes bacterium]|nr:nucleoside deaminase [Bacteroidota bacterium]MCL2303155.1 nucleoside deaminase [Lentimicrobiaceae bacterium]
MFFSDEYFMQMALREAETAFEQGEIPVGAVIVLDNTVIAKAHNLTQTLNDVTAHAEMQALTSAFHHLGAKYLSDCVLYVTLEPCVMCAGALFWSQIGRVVYGASDPKRGYSLVNVSLLHPKTEVVQGVLAKESQALLEMFFQKLRT